MRMRTRTASPLYIGVLSAVAGMGWSCGETVEGCLVHVCCSSNFPLISNSLQCHLDNVEYDCKY